MAVISLLRSSARISQNVLAGQAPALLLIRRVRIAANFALFLIVLANVCVLVLHLSAPRVEAGLAPDAMVEEGGDAFTVPLPHLRYPYTSVSDDNGVASSLVLREDDRPLGQAHSLHQKIRDLGEGRYSHWYQTLYFSSSDHSDPRKNGRIYAVTFQAVVDPFLIRALNRMEVILGVILACCCLFLAIPESAQRPEEAVKIALGMLVFCVLAELPNPALMQRVVMLPWIILIVLYLGYRFLPTSSGFGLGSSPSAADANLQIAPCEATPKAQNVFWRSSRFSHSVVEKDKVTRLLGLSLDLSCVSVAAGLFLYFGPLEIYPATGWVDPAIYQGYFKHYDFNLSLNGFTYFAERFAFLVPGILFFGYLPLEWAHYGLAALPFMIISASLFYVVRSVADWPLSIGALSLVCVNALVVGSVGQGYVGGILLASLFAGFTWLYGSVLGSGYRVQTLAAGCCFGVAAFTHPIAVFCIPGTLCALLIAFPHTRENLFSRLTWGGAGGVVALVGFGLTSKILNGSFDFLTPAIKQIEGDTVTLFQMPFSIWAPYATRLWYVIIVALGGVAVLLRGDRTFDSGQRLAFSLLRWTVLSLLAVAAPLVYSDAFLGTVYLSYWFYSSYLVVCTIVISSVMLALLVPAGTGRLGRFVVCFICICGAALAVLLPLATQGMDPDRLHLGAVSLIGGTTSILGLWLAGDRRIRVPDLRAGLAALAVVIPPLILNLNPDTRHVFVYQDPSFRDAAFTANEADDFIIGSLHGRTPFFWYYRDKYSKTANNSVDFNLPRNGTYPGWFLRRRYTGILDQIWGRYYTGQLLGLDDLETIPDWDPILRQKTRPTAIVVLSQDQGDGDRVIQSARALYGAELALIDHKLISHGSSVVYVWVLDVVYGGHELRKS
jgi:hypothetical protein